MVMAGVMMVMLTVVMFMTRLACWQGHVETATTQYAIAKRSVRECHCRVQTRRTNGFHRPVRQGRTQVEQRSSEHIAGHAAEWVKVEMHHRNARGKVSARHTRLASRSRTHATIKQHANADNEADSANTNCIIGTKRVQKIMQRAVELQAFVSREWR